MSCNGNCNGNCNSDSNSIGDVETDYEVGLGIGHAEGFYEGVRSILDVVSLLQSNADDFKEPFVGSVGDKLEGSYASWDQGDCDCEDCQRYYGCDGETVKEEDPTEEAILGLSAELEALILRVKQVEAQVVELKNSPPKGSTNYPTWDMWNT